jgi:outer membrane protein insertion porin family
LRHTFILSFIIALLLWGTSSASAQRAKSEKYKILGISVEGNQSQAGTETSAIIANSGLKIGDVISIPGDETRQAIQRLWALRIFSDIQILIENKVDDGVYLLIKVTEYQRMGRLEIIGADDVSEDDIKKKITIANGQILTPDDISRAVQNIKVLYEEEGHLLAEITPELVPFDTLGQTRAILRLTIDEGEKLTINSILFTGNNAFSESDLRGEMEDTKPKRWWHIILANPKFETKKYEEANRKFL